MSKHSPSVNLVLHVDRALQIPVSVRMHKASFHTDHALDLAGQAGSMQELEAQAMAIATAHIRQHLQDCKNFRARCSKSQLLT